MSEQKVEPLEFSKFIRKCQKCNKPTPFFVSEVWEETEMCEVLSPKNAKPIVLWSSDYFEPKKPLSLEHPICPQCYKKFYVR